MSQDDESQKVPTVGYDEGELRRAVADMLADCEAGGEVMEFDRFQEILATFERAVDAWKEAGMLEEMVTPTVAATITPAATAVAMPGTVAVVGHVSGDVSLDAGEASRETLESAVAEFKGPETIVVGGKEVSIQPNSVKFREGGPAFLVGQTLTMRLKDGSTCEATITKATGPGH